MRQINKYRIYILKIMRNIFEFTFFIYCIRIYACEVCDGDKTSCCEGFMWDKETGKCKKCNPGYTGVSCQMSCPFPTYGDACQKTCNCSKRNCDFESGCNKSYSNEVSKLTSMVTAEVNRTAKETNVYTLDRILTSAKPTDLTVTTNETFYLKTHPKKRSYFSNKSLFIAIITLGLLVAFLGVFFIIFTIREKLKRPLNMDDTVQTGNHEDVIELQDLSQRDF